jgi:enoyl-CoA hydratase/carnithine racemase
MGLNEIRLGVPVPYLADCALRYIVGARKAREIMDAGEFYDPATSLRMCLVDEVFLVGDVVTRSVEKAKMVGAWPREAFAVIKRNRVEEIENRVLAQWKEKERMFVDCWFSDVARKRLREAIEKF